MRQVVIPDIPGWKTGMAKNKASQPELLVDPMDVGWRLLCFREASKLGSQTKFAKGAGIARTTYVGWETGASRLSLSGALTLVEKYRFLSLDYLYLGRTGAILNLPLQDEIARLLARRVL